ncbi:MAG TPA: PA2779 family protein [Thermodesulfobacteriota bacterium]|nr:PA2779 family protein [Thermodesulfobacteriota bacterium]
MNFVKKMYFRQVALVVAFAILIIGCIPSKSMAYVVGAEGVAAASSRAQDMERVQRVLESKLVAGKLDSAGLNKAEIKNRLERLSDSELHQFAGQLDSLYPGGDVLGLVIALLIIVILVMVILKLADRKIVIK